MLSRRQFLQAAAAGAVSPMLPASAAHTVDVPTSVAKLASMTKGAASISVAERRARIAAAQSLLREYNFCALLMESGSSLEYFTGIRWHRSERVTAAVIPADGEFLVVTPAFEERSVRETLKVGGDVRPWDEHENPFEKVAQCLRDRSNDSGRVAAESTIRFFIVAGVRQALPGIDIVPADPALRACRLFKSPAELALMQLAHDVTLAALKFVHGQVKIGMSAAYLSARMDKATGALGGDPEFSLAAQRGVGLPAWLVKTANRSPRLRDPDGLRVQCARLSVRYFAHLGVRRRDRAPTQGLGYRQTGAGNRARNRQARHCRGHHR